MDKIILGIDVAKEWLDVAVAGASGVQRIDNKEEAIKAWLAKFGPDHIHLAAFEPTGGYERILRRCLRDSGVAFVRVHPNEIVAFRKRRAITEVVPGEKPVREPVDEVAGSGVDDCPRADVDDDRDGIRPVDDADVSALRRVRSGSPGRAR